MKQTLKTALYLLSFGVLISCGTKKNTFLSRNYQALTTKYNVLFNGKQAFESGVTALNNDYKDDYWKRLPIEPIVFDDRKIAAPKFDNSLGAPGFVDTEVKKSDFDIAEEKAVKAIQVHSMNFKGRERNRQIDDAYLLLGKSRYYTQRFIPAIEAFNYVIENYPYANLINETKIWRAKANIRNDYEELAIESLDILLSKTDLPKLHREQAHTALAIAYTQLDSTHRVIEHLTKAIRIKEDPAQTARNMFVLGQIYSEQGKIDSARMVFKNLTKLKKAPYRFKIYADIEIVNNTPKDTASESLIARFQDLIKNRDNRPYLDVLYYQMGVLEENRDSVSDAIAFYQKSLRASKENIKQKTATFEKLGSLYFKEAKYQMANTYFDSVLQTAKKPFDLKILSVQRKSKRLADLIKYENRLAVNDSILRIAVLSKEDQTAFFSTYVAKLKKEDEKKAQQQLNAINFGSSFGQSVKQGSSNKGKWYFYNTQSLLFGEQEFEKVWGTRKLEDGWRWSDKSTATTEQEETLTKNKTVDRYDVAAYVKSIPSEKAVLDSLVYTRNEALFQLGLIYKEQFPNPKKAVQDFERLLDSEPDKKWVLPTYYHLYQLYKNHYPNQENRYKTKLVEEYPESIFTKSILNPNAKVEQEAKVSEIEEAYKKAYYLYKDNSFVEVVQEIDKLLPSITNSELLPKFELLKAYAIGKYQDVEAYKKALEFVAVTYATSEEGIKAKEIMAKIKD